MNILYRYIGKTVITYMLVVVLIFVGLEMFILFINELQDIGKGTYGVLQALVYVPLQLPQAIYELFPVAGLIGSLIGLGRLASSSELIVMRASGVSKAQITYAVILATLVMLILATFMGEVIAPEAKNFAENYKGHAVSGGQTLSSQEGIWVHDGDNFIHINDIVSKGHLSGILRYQFNQQHLQLASYAQSGYYQNGRWYFNNVNESQMQANQITTQHYAQQVWPVSFSPNLLRTTLFNTDRASLVSLFHYIKSLKQIGLSTNRYEYTFWKRILQPIATIVMICLAIPFIFGPLRTVTMGLRILIGVMFGIAFFTLNQFFGPFSMVYQLPPIWAAAMPIILFGMIDAILLYKTR